jgi:inhibitor of KinA sporulation pathway (predicted exonuclease)
MMPLIFLDLEFTCWPNNNPWSAEEIIEIGAVITDEHLKEIRHFHSYVRPVMNPILSQYCRDLLGIEQNDVESAETFSYVWRDFYFTLFRIFPLENYTIFHWGNRDPEMIWLECQRQEVRNDMQIPRTQYIDFSAVYESIITKEKFRPIRKPPILREAAFDEGVPGWQHSGHDALGDAYLLLDVARKYPDRIRSIAQCKQRELP